MCCFIDQMIRLVLCLIQYLERFAFIALKFPEALALILVIDAALLRLSSF
jgi:hypothetical protein